MSLSEEEIRELEKETQKRRAEQRAKEILERSEHMNEEDKEKLHHLENPLSHITFAPVWFANFSLPHTDKAAAKEGTDGSPARELVLVNGDRKLTLYSRDGLPSGMYARKFLFWVTTQALRRQHLPLYEARRIPVKSLRAMMKEMDIPVSGGRTGSAPKLRAQINRVLKMTYDEDYVDSPQIDDFTNNRIAQKAFFQWEQVDGDTVDLFEGSHITLDSSFFQGIIDGGAVPLDKRILKKLSRSPLATDIYVWLTYRLSYVSQLTPVKYSQLYKQFATGYSDTKTGHFNFNARAEAAFLKVFDAWEEVTGEAIGARKWPLGIALLREGKPSVPKQVLTTIASSTPPETDSSTPLF